MSPMKNCIKINCIDCPESERSECEKLKERIELEMENDPKEVSSINTEDTA